MIKSEMRDVLAAMGALWPQADVERRYAAGMAIMCGELPADDVLAALRALAREGDREFPPPPGVVARKVYLMGLAARAYGTLDGGHRSPDTGSALRSIGNPETNE